MAKSSSRRTAANRPFTVIVTHRASPDAEARLTRLARVCLAAVAAGSAAIARESNEAGDATGARATNTAGPLESGPPARAPRAAERDRAHPVEDHRRGRQSALSSAQTEPTRRPEAAQPSEASEASEAGEAAPFKDKVLRIKTT